MKMQCMIKDKEDTLDKKFTKRFINAQGVSFNAAKHLVGEAQPHFDESSVA
ncbi:unnamed protein product [Dovyalis caffra]|uniref:Uncharacterized protein n=1 Tax=Dovyalis caffra TaxID=77055 RepID=A0AAV1RFW3_9ROSI|nr:unnamed protein product [Dovyalis caffra]